MFFGILQRTLYRELLSTFLAVLIVLLLITFGSEVSRLLAKAVKGEIHADLVFQLLFLQIPRSLDVVVPLVTLIAVLLTFGRMHQDHEMVVMQSCGIQPSFFKKTVMWFALPVALFMSWSVLDLTPWSYQQQRVITDDSNSRSVFAGITAGKFNELPDNSGVIYAQEINENGEMKQVWVKYTADENDLILTAEQGVFLRDEQGATLQLHNGWRYGNMHDFAYAKPLEVQKFVLFEGMLPELALSQSKPRQAEKTLPELLASNDDRDVALLHSRLVTPLSIFVMALVALRLSKTGPRQGRFAKLFLALLIFIIYNQLVLAAKGEIEKGANPAVIWLLPTLTMLWALGVHESLIQKVRSMFKKPKPPKIQNAAQSSE